MRAVCVSDKYCPYKTDTGYCGYTGMGCHLESTGNSIATLNIPQESEYKIVRAVDISDESIEKIADAVVEKFLQGIKVWNKQYEATCGTDMRGEAND